MKTRLTLFAIIALLGFVALTVLAAETLRLDALPGAGSKVRIEGTSSIHDWQCEAPFIGGYVEAGPNFPTSASQDIKPGKVDAKAYAWITARALKSLTKEGKPYEEKMDNIIYEKLKVTEFNRINYYLSELVLKETPKSAGAPFIFDSTGDLVVAGVTNKISMPVNVTVIGEKKVKITGNTNVKRSEFKIEPQKIAMGIAKTGDDVKIFVEWVVGQKTAAAAAKP